MPRRSGNHLAVIYSDSAIVVTGSSATLVIPRPDSRRSAVAGYTTDAQQSLQSIAASDTQMLATGFDEVVRARWLGETTFIATFGDGASFIFDSTEINPSLKRSRYPICQPSEYAIAVDFIGNDPSDDYGVDSVALRAKRDAAAANWISGS